jgi:hypothetical protein
MPSASRALKREMRKKTAKTIKQATFTLHKADQELYVLVKAEIRGERASTTLRGN